MSRRSWVFIAAIVGLAFSQVAWAAPPQEKDQHQNAVTAQQAPQQGPAPKVESKRPDYNLDSCYQSPDQQNADLCAQWRSAVAAEKATKLAYWSNLISGGGAALSFLSVVLVLVALKFARDANSIAREIGQKQVRAYVADEKIDFELDAPIGVGQKGHFNIHWKNTGQSPAIRWGMSAELHLLEPTRFGEPITGFDDLAKSVALATTSLGVGTVKWFGPINLTAGDMGAWLSQTRRVLIHAFVRYEDIFGAEHHTETCHIAIPLIQNGNLTVRYAAYPHHNGAT